MTDLAVTGERPGLTAGPSLYATNGWFVFGGICFVYFFFNWYLQTQVLTDQVYTYSLGNQVDPDKLNAFLQDQHRMSLLSYGLVPVTLVLKTALVAFCLLTGLLLTSQKLSFSKIFRIALFAETAFVAAALLKLLLLAFSRNVQSLGEYIHFAPLSLYSLFPASSVPVWLSYPLQTLDVFQAGYVLLLAAGLRFYMGQPYRNMLRLVLYSYGVGLLACMVGFAFISISSHP